MVRSLRIEMTQWEDATPTQTSGLETRVSDVVGGQGRSFYKFNPLPIRNQDPDDLNDMSDKSFSRSQNGGY
jgi:hypothetical protein